MLPLTHVAQGSIPTPIVKYREWSTVNGTLAGFFFEFRLRRLSMKVDVTGVAFIAGEVVRTGGENAMVPL